MTPRDQLLAALVAERSVIAQDSLQRVMQECLYRSRQGAPVSLAQLLVYRQQIDQASCQQLEHEAALRGRSCGRCRRVFLKLEGGPEQCPSCGGAAGFVAPGGAGASGVVSSGVSSSPLIGPSGPPAAGGYGAGVYGSGVYGSGVRASEAFASGGFPAFSSGGLGASSAAPGLGAPSPRPLASGAPGLPATAPPLLSTRPDSSDRHGAQASLSVGGQFAGHEIVSELGRGGMGVVYKAREVSSGELVALKVLLAGELASKKIIKRFGEEVKALKQLDHPGIIPIRSFGVEAGKHFYTMDFIDGRELEKDIKEKKISPRRGVEILAKAARAIHVAHERGIVHRDLKPGNILLDADGDPIIMDFGLAKDLQAKHSMTRSGVPLGTPYYMPPEQARGDHRSIDARADVYSLGAVLYEILAQRVPFKAQTTTDLLRLIIERDPTPPRQLRPRCPADYEAICLKALSKRPEDRYQTAEALADDLDAALAGEGVAAHAGSLQRRLRGTLKARRSALIWSFVGVTVMTLLGLAFMARERAAKAAKEARRLELEKRKDQERVERRRAREAVEEAERQAKQEAEAERARSQAQRRARLADRRTELRDLIAQATRAQTVAAWRASFRLAETLGMDIKQEFDAELEGEDYYNAGIVNRALGQFDQALTCFERAAKKGAFVGRAGLAFGLLRFDLERDKASAVSYFAEISKRSEKLEGLRLPEREAVTVARCYSSYLGDARRAKETLDALSKVSPQVEASLLKAQVYRDLMVRSKKDKTRYLQLLKQAALCVRTSFQIGRFRYFLLVRLADLEFQMKFDGFGGRGAAQGRKVAERYLDDAERISTQLPDAYEVRAMVLALTGDARVARLTSDKAYDKAKRRPTRRAHTERRRRTILRLIEQARAAKVAQPSSGPALAASSPEISLEVHEEDARTPRTYSVVELDFKPLLKVTKSQAGYRDVDELRRAGRYRQALQGLDALLAAEPQHFKLRVLRGFLLLRLRRVKEASSLFAILSKEAPGDFWLRKFRALCLLRGKRPAEAAALFSTLLSEHPRDGECFYFGGVAALDQKRYDVAEQIARKGLEINPKERLFHSLLMDSLGGQGRWKDAAAPARAAASGKRVEAALILNLLVVLSRGRSFVAEDRPMFDALLKMQIGKRAVVHYALGVYESQHGSPEGARSALAKARSLLDPKSAQGKILSKLIAEAFGFLGGAKKKG